MAASEAAVRGAAAEQIAWVDALAWQVQRRITEANLQASKANPTVLTLREKASGEFNTKLSCRHFSNRPHINWRFDVPGNGGNVKSCKQSMGETSLVRWLRAGPCSGEIQTMQSVGNSLGMDVKQVRAGGIHSNWVENRASVAFSGPVPRYHVVLELCGMDIAIFVQVECAMYGGVIKASARDVLSRIKRGYPFRAKMSWPLPATATEELLLVATLELMGLFREVEAQPHWCLLFCLSLYGPFSQSGTVEASRPSGIQLRALYSTASFTVLQDVRLMHESMAALKRGPSSPICGMSCWNSSRCGKSA